MSLRPHHRQSGGTLLGIIIGLVIGLAIALAVVRAKGHNGFGQ